MAFPDVTKTLDLLGYRAKDKITGLEGVVTTISFDLYGCVQVVLHQGLDKDKRILEQHWFDIGRLEMLKKPRVMMPPTVGTVAPRKYNMGPAEKPLIRSV